MANHKKFEEETYNLYSEKGDFILSETEKEHPYGNDPVDHPAHYTQGKQEAIDIIEGAIDAAPSVQAGFLQAQVLKYLLRLWHKDNPRQDAKKAKWYLKRLIDSL